VNISKREFWTVAIAIVYSAALVWVFLHYHESLVPYSRKHPIVVVTILIGIAVYATTALFIYRTKKRSKYGYWPVLKVLRNTSLIIALLSLLLGLPSGIFLAAIVASVVLQWLGLAALVSKATSKDVSDGRDNWRV
jgi:uncharacterized membrane protein YhaH (DUF805 family)